MKTNFDLEMGRCILKCESQYVCGNLNNMYIIAFIASNVLAEIELLRDINPRKTGFF